MYLSQQAQGGSGMWMFLDLASVEDLAALHQEYQAKAAKIIEPPTDKPWAMREMLVKYLTNNNNNVTMSTGTTNKETAHQELYMKVSLYSLYSFHPCRKSS